MAILNQQKSIDTSKFLEIKGNYTVNTNDKLLTFKKNDYSYLSLTYFYLRISDNDYSPSSTAPAFDMILTPRMTTVNYNRKVDLLQLEVNLTNTQIYLRNYDSTGKKVSSQIHLTAKGEITAFDNTGGGSLDLIKGTLNRDIIITKRDFDALVARVTALESAK